MVIKNLFLRCGHREPSSSWTGA